MVGLQDHYHDGRGASGIHGVVANQMYAVSKDGGHCLGGGHGVYLEVTDSTLAHDKGQLQ